MRVTMMAVMMMVAMMMFDMGIRTMEWLSPQKGPTAFAEGLGTGGERTEVRSDLS
jgi:hypothetical protein